MSNVPENLEYIGRVSQLRDKIETQTLIICNCDVMDRQQGLQLAEQYKLDGIMIGRGLFHDPFAFAQDSPWPDFTREQRIELYKKHIQLFADTWKNGERPIHTLNKFCKIYISGFDGAKELREELMEATSTAELLKLLKISIEQHLVYDVH